MSELYKEPSFDERNNKVDMTQSYDHDTVIVVPYEIETDKRNSETYNRADACFLAAKITSINHAQKYVDEFLKNGMYFAVGVFRLEEMWTSAPVRVVSPIADR